MKLNVYVTKTGEETGRTYTRRPVTLLSGVFTASVNGTAVELGDRAVLNLELVVTAATGTTPTNTIKIQGSNDGTNWYDIASFTQLTTGASTQRLPVLAARWVRAVSTIAGTTPSYTLTLSGEAA